MTEATKRCKVAVLISGSGSNLQALIDAQLNQSIVIDIVHVISNRPGVAGLERAEKAGIPTTVLDHKAFADRLQFDQALIKVIDNSQADLVVLAGFMRILTPEFVRHFQGKMLNIHPSLLPKYPGLHTHQRALDAGDKQHGVTVHFVTEELDGGPPVIQASVPVNADDTADSLARKVQKQEHIIYPMAVAWFAEGRLNMENETAFLDGEPLAKHGYQVVSS